MLGIQNSRVAGMVAMLFAVAFFAFMDACLKGLTAHYSAAQVAAIRGLASFPIVLVWALLVDGAKPLLHVRWPLQALRGALAVVMLITFSYGIKTLSLSEAYAIFFVAPLLVTLLSTLLLGERAAPLQWLAIAAGFAGVLIVLQPTGAGVVSIGGIAILVCAACYSGTAVLVKLIGRTDSTHSMMVWMTGILAFGSTAIALPEWQGIRAEDWRLIGLVAVFGTLAQYCITVAFQRAPAAAVAPLEYTALAWGALIDYLVWATLPQARMLVGAAIVIGCGLLLFRHETQSAAASHP
jgi:drug/metabolite transporter (DMT)-like permease